MKAIILILSCVIIFLTPNITIGQPKTSKLLPSPIRISLKSGWTLSENKVYKNIRISNASKPGGYITIKFVADSLTNLKTIDDFFKSDFENIFKNDSYNPITKGDTLLNNVRYLWIQRIINDEDYKSYDRHTLIKWKNKFYYMQCFTESKRLFDEAITILNTIVFLD